MSRPNLTSFRYLATWLTLTAFTAALLLVVSGDVDRVMHAGGDAPGSSRPEYVGRRNIEMKYLTQSVEQSPSTWFDGFEIVGQIGGYTQAVFMGDRFAYFGVGQRVVVLDIANLKHPTLIGWGPMLGCPIADIAGQIDTLFVACGSNLHVLDARDPKNLAWVTEMSFEAVVTGVVVSDTHAFLSVSGLWLRVIDISDLQNLRKVGDLAIDSDGNPASGKANGIAINGDRNLLLIAADAEGVHAIDISDPTRPILESSFDQSRGFTGLSLAVAISGSRAFVAATSGLHVLELSGPNGPSRITTVPMPAGGLARDVAIDGQRVFVAEWRDSNTQLGGVVIVDAADPNSQARKAFTQGLPLGIAVRNDIAYVASANGWRIADLTDSGAISRSSPTSPIETDQVRLPAGGSGIDVSGDKLFVADGDAGISVVDITDPSSMKHLGSLAALGEIHQIVADTDTAFVGALDRGLSTIRISNPKDPTLLDSEALRGWVRSLTKVNRHVFLGLSSTETMTGLYIFAVANPDAIGKPQKVLSGETIRDFATFGDRGFSVSNDFGLRIWDLSDPGEPKQLGQGFRTTGYGITVQGDLAYIAGDKPLLKIVNVQDPNNIQELGRYSAVATAGRVAVADGIAYLATGGILDAVDVSSPDKPRRRAYFRGSLITDVALRDDVVFVADALQGITALRLLPPPTPTLVPTHTATTIATERPSVTPLATPTDAPTPTASSNPTPAATPTPVPFLPWPAPTLVANIRILLTTYYNREASATTPGNLLAPITEADKAPAAKDPDTLWEALALQLGAGGRFGASPSCHSINPDAPDADAQFIDCTGARLAFSKDAPYDGGLSLFRPPPAGGRGSDPAFYFDSDIVNFAGQYALYHAFARDFDAPRTGPYTPASSPDREPRDFKRYHERMIRAYEAHMRDTLVRMLRDTRTDAGFQLALTRSVGWLLTPYVWTIQAMEEYQAWTSFSDRRAAFAVVNALNQRIWWEWVVPQPNGPRTAGKAALGSQATFDGAPAADRLTETDHVVIAGQSIPSLRPDAAAGLPGNDGLTFDADYAIPGELWCREQFRPAGSPNWQRCMTLARRQSLGGGNSPFGHYYGTIGSDGRGDCSHRAGLTTNVDCGQTNLGSMAEEWLGTYIGARAGMQVVENLVASADPAAPSGVLGSSKLDSVTRRLGYGVAGFHGGSGGRPVSPQDDLEWPPPGEAGPTIAIRTLSAARHDGEAQNGRFSLGESDTVGGLNPGRDDTRGDTWPELDEYPGGIENHAPGPSPIYGATLASQVLSDKIDGGMSPSLFDAKHRNHPDEFESWVWLLQATYYRCQGVSDPADPACFAFSPGNDPIPPTLRRRALFVDPDDTSVPAPMRYAWRDEGGLVKEGLVAEGDGSCRKGVGLAFGRMPVFGPTGQRFLLTEHGFGAYGLLLQSGGAFMRLAAARYPETPPEDAPPGMQAVDYQRQRDEVLVPWYNEMHRLVGGILRLYGEGASNLGYIPDAENAPCAQLDGATLAPLTRRSGAGAWEQTIAARARWYSAAALWYWWYDSEWLDVE